MHRMYKNTKAPESWPFLIEVVYHDVSLMFCFSADLVNCWCRWVGTIKVSRKLVASKESLI